MSKANSNANNYNFHYLTPQT